MSKVVVFNGSPRTNGYTTKLLAQVAAGAKSRGAEIIEFDLNDPAIRGCQGCFYCRTHDGCAVNDYLQPMYSAIKEADSIVLGSPIYYYQVTGQARIWLDRTFPMVGDGFMSRHPGKKALTIYTQGNPNPEIGQGAIKFISNIIESTYGWNIVDTIHCCGTNNMDQTIFDELSEKSYLDGQKLAD
jgi:Multimeric flavodoxin WrbA